MRYVDHIISFIKSSFSDKKVTKEEFRFIIYGTINLSNAQYSELKAAYNEVSWKLFNLNTKKKKLIYRLLAWLNINLVDTSGLEYIKSNLEWINTYYRTLKNSEREAILRILTIDT